MLGDFHLLDGLSERSAVTGAILSGDSDLLRTLGLKRCEFDHKVEKRINLNVHVRSLTHQITKPKIPG